MGGKKLENAIETSASEMVQSSLFCSKFLANFPVVFILLFHLFFQVYILKHTQATSCQARTSLV